MNTPIKVRTGQAIIELALGLFVIALLSSALFYLVQYMTRSLGIQNHLRSSTAVYAGRIELDEFGYREVFGMKNLHINEPHGSTARDIPNAGGLNP